MKEVTRSRLQLCPLVPQNGVGVLPARPRRHKLVVQQEAHGGSEFGLHLEEFRVTGLPRVPGSDDLVVQKVLRRPGNFSPLENKHSVRVLPVVPAGHNLVVQKVLSSAHELLALVRELHMARPP